MATLTGSAWGPVYMLDPQFAFTDYNSIIETADGFQIGVETPSGRHQVYTGSFQYDDEGLIDGYATTLAEYTPGFQPIYTITNFYLSVAQFAVFVVNNDSDGQRNHIFGGNDTIFGSDGYSDTLVGFAGDDWIKGGGGQDEIRGGTGSDTAAYSGNRSDYQIFKTNGQLIITDRRGIEGTDSLYDVEYLSFNDQTIVANHAPVAVVANLTPAHGTVAIAASGLFTITDADAGDTLQYQIFDGTTGNGSFRLNGGVQVENQNITLNASDLADLDFKTSGAGTDTLWVRAYDGVVWSPWQTFTVGAVPNAAPVATVSNRTPTRADTFIAGANLFSASDADGDALSYRFFDGTAGNGYFTLHGNPLATMANIDVSAADLANFGYVTSTTGAGDTLWVQAFDGYAWSAWKSFTVAAPANVEPVAIVQNLAPAKGTAFIAGSGLVSVLDPDDPSVVRYRFFDGTSGNGRFQLNGVDQVENQNITVEAADFTNFRFRTGTSGSDVLWVQAFDGAAWSAWKSFNVAAPINIAPTVAVQNLSPAKTDAFIAGSALFTVTDPDDTSMVKYRFFDGTAGNGYFTLNSIQQATLANIEINAADLANFGYVVSTTARTSDTLWVQAYDGTVWSAWKSFTVTDNAPQVRFSVAIEDPQNQFGAYHNAVSSTLQAAANLWSDHLAGDAHLEIRIRFFDANNSNRASGQSAVGVNIGSHAGNVLFEEGTQYEIRTGIDPNGSNPDIEITATEDYIKNFLWFDSNPSTRTAPVPLNRNDAVSIFVHELGHALGFNGWIGSAPGFESEYDSHIVTSGGHRFFTGANATALYGGPVPLTDNSGTHVGNASPLPGSDLADDTMGGVVAKFGVRTEPTALNLAILNDLGVAIKAGTAQRDVLSVVDSNGGTIDGRGGDDLFRGGSGNDTLIGGAGSDTIGFSGARSDYVITKANGTITVSDQRAGSGDGTDTLSEVEFLQFNDGTIAANRGPMVAVGDLTPGRAVTMIAAANLFSVSDPDGDAMAQYRFFDGTGGNGRFELNGIAQAALQNITIDANDLANFRFRRGTSGTDVLWVQVSDGLVWSGWKTFTVTAPANIAPVLNVQGLMPAKTESFIAGSALFAVTDPDDASMAKYRFFDGTAGNGRFTLNSTNQAELANIEIDASDLANFRYLTSTTGTGDTLWVQAYDGFAWSTWKSFTVTAPVNTAPIVSIANLNPSKSTTFIAGASLFTVADPDDVAMTKYRFFDGTAGNGRLTLGGALQVELANIEVNAADLANFGYTVSGTGTGDTLWVQAYDGFAWSAWKSFNVAAPVNAAPVVNASDMSTVLSVISAGTLFTITDPDDASMVRYRLFDGTIGSGRFQWNGVNQVENQNITVETADLADFDFVVGTSDVLWVQAFDGFA